LCSSRIKDDFGLGFRASLSLSLSLRLSLSLSFSLSLSLFELSRAAAKERATVRDARTCRPLSFNNLSLLAGECLRSRPRGMASPPLSSSFYPREPRKYCFFRSGRGGKILNWLPLLGFFRRARRLLASGECKLFVGYYYRLSCAPSHLVLDVAGNVSRDYPRLLLLLFKECLAGSRSASCHLFPGLFFCRRISFLDVIYFFPSFFAEGI